MSSRLAIRTLALTMLLAALGTACSHEKKEGSDAAPGKGSSTETNAEPKVSRDTNGNAAVSIGAKLQSEMGLVLKNPQPAQVNREVKGYGRVLDATPLVSLMNELALANGAYNASSNELARLKTLTGQGNASERALQAAEAAALHDQLTVQAARTRLALSWGKALGEQTDVPAFVQGLTALETILVRIDLPPGEALSSLPTSARITSLSGGAQQAAFLAVATDVDAQLQGRGFIFRVNQNPPVLTPGEAVTGYLDVPGPPLDGVTIPREAVVRTEGSGWVYTLNPGGEAFTRIQVPLERSTPAGWFVQQQITTNDTIVTTGAQQLLSLELKGQSGD